MSSPPLPYRPLEVRGHGVWDPARSAFYPFYIRDAAVSGTLLAGEKGYCYYVRLARIEIVKAGDSAEGSCYISFTTNGITKYFETFYPVTAAAAGNGVSVVDCATLDLLCDPGTGIMYSEGVGVVSTGVVVVAKIPADEGEV